jgi:hypothetical protein
MLSCDLRKTIAVALVFSTLLVTMPVTAADFGNSKSVIGSVSAVGPVELRGVGISQEGTLFSGDRIRAGQKGYAKVLLGTGNKIELQEKTDVSINRDAKGIQIAMNAGTVGFTATNPLRVGLSQLEVIASDGAAGHVAVMGPTTAGVRALNGKVTIKNVKTSESFVLTKGQERLFRLTDGVNAPSLGELASNVPGPVPAPRPQAPAGQTTGGLNMDAGGWLAVIGGAAVAGIAIWGLVVALDNRDETDDLESSINNLNNTIAANNAANQQAIKNVSNASAVANTAAQSQAQMASVAALAGQAQVALAVAGNAAGAGAAASLAAQASAVQSQLAGVLSQVQALQAQFAAGGGSTTQLNTLLQQVDQLRNVANGIATNLNTLLTNNRTTPGVPQTSVGLIGPTVIASASIPV